MTSERVRPHERSKNLAQLMEFWENAGSNKLSSAPIKVYTTTNTTHSQKPRMPTTTPTITRTIRNISAPSDTCKPRPRLPSHLKKPIVKHESGINSHSIRMGSDFIIQSTASSPLPSPSHSHESSSYSSVSSIDKSENSKCSINDIGDDKNKKKNESSDDLEFEELASSELKNKSFKSTTTSSSSLTNISPLEPDSPIDTILCDIEVELEEESHGNILESLDLSVISQRIPMRIRSSSFKKRCQTDIQNILVSTFNHTFPTTSLKSITGKQMTAKVKKNSHLIDPISCIVYSKGTN